MTRFIQIAPHFARRSLDGKEGKLKKTFEETQTELFDAKARLPKAEAEKGELEEKEGALKKLHQEFTARAEESKANSQQGTNKSEAVAGLLKASKKGGELAKAGILGRLGDICTVSEKYDVAVSTACGSLDNIVVETTAGAQMCLQFLRKVSREMRPALFRSPRLTKQFNPIQCAARPRPR